jgi:hypothetical protein
MSNWAMTRRPNRNSRMATSMTPNKFGRFRIGEVVA